MEKSKTVLNKMQELLSVKEFVDETKEDYHSPTTSTFVDLIPRCRYTVSKLEENIDSNRDGLVTMKKALKAIYNGGNAHVDNEMYLAKVLEKLTDDALNKNPEPDIATAFTKFSVVIKELSALMKTLMQSLNNTIMFPIDNILKGDLKEGKGDLRKPFEKAWRDYESKINKIEKEKKQQAKEAGLIKTEIASAEIAEEMEKERKMFQLQMCEYLIKENEIKTKSGIDLLQHFIDYYYAQCSYFQDGLKTIEHFHNYINQLSSKIDQVKHKQEVEKKKLLDLRHLLKSSYPFLNGNLKEISQNANAQSSDRRESKFGYSLHQMQGNKNYGCSKYGYLMKKSEGKMKVKVWQKRKCEVKGGYLYIYHSDESKSPTKMNLLICQVKTVPSEKKAFDLISYNRTYHFQTEDENDAEAWISVLINSKEGALKKELDNNSTFPSYDYDSSQSKNQSLIELRQNIINQILKLPGNDKCVDCNSTKDPTWLSTNFGVLLCIECSGIHRELGVHISRIQSLTLDNIGTSQLLLARVVSNNRFNEILEAILEPNHKLSSNSSMEERYKYIRAKYVDKKFSLNTCSGNIHNLKSELKQAILSRDIYQLIQIFIEGADLTWSLTSFEETQDTALHLAISIEDNTTLHIIDFIAQNSSNLNIQNKEGNTPLHMAVFHYQSECLKLLLRSGASLQIENQEGKTPLQIAKEKDLNDLIELFEHALQNKKNMFENVNIDWNLTLTEDVSTDFSDDDLVDDKYQQSTFSSQPYDFRNSVRFYKSNITNNELPSNRFHESFNSSQSSKTKNFYNPTLNVTKKLNYSSNLSKSTTNTPENETKKTSNFITSRLPANEKLIKIQAKSESAAMLINSFNQQIVSSDAEVTYSNELEENNSYSTSSKQKHLTTLPHHSPHHHSNLQRPRVPPPPLPAQQIAQFHERLRNGKSSDNLFSLSNETLEFISNRTLPVPPPRKRHDMPMIRLKRCRTLYDCNADREDELAFKEGEMIVILSEKTDEEEWMEGFIEGEPERKGVFPVNFVEMIPE